jgi:X-Pro dipeptidyl-peptidase
VHQILERRPRSRLLFAAAGVLALSATLVPVSATPATADDDVPHVEGTQTVPVYDYEDAIRETIYVESSVDSDQSGDNDRIAMDIIRPREADELGVDVPVIMVASPYYHCCGRGNDGELKTYDEDGNPVGFPLFYDNYFVPRGYAVALVDLAGTAKSEGCMDVGGIAEVESAVATIDWLNGNADGYDADGAPAVADWTTGYVGMIGKSWDGSVANGAAATGVEGLETIVPITAISNWYNYTRENGTIISRGYATFLHNFVNGRPSAVCAHTRQDFSQNQADDTGVYNDFWAERDYVPDADNVDASVFVVHGLGDTNVKTNHVGPWYEALSEAGVERKIWWYQTGHEEPFDVDREKWVDEIHRWFDSELQKLDNGILDEPRSTIEVSSGEWIEEAQWPAPSTAPVRLSLSGSGGDGTGELSLRGTRPRETAQYSTGQVLAFSTGELTSDLRISGDAELRLRIQVDRPTVGIRTRLVEHGQDLQVVSSSVRTLSSEDCWGEGIPEDDGCFRQTEPIVNTSNTRILTYGDASAAHWRSLSSLDALQPGRWYELSIPIRSTDRHLVAGNRLSLELRANNPNYTALPWSGANITIDQAQSRLVLPTTGSIAALTPRGPRVDMRSNEPWPAVNQSAEQLAREFN